MTKEKSDNADGGKFRFAQYVPQIIILGIVLAVGGIRLFCPTFWKNYSIPILLIAAGIAIPFLFIPWKFWAGYGFQVGIAPGLAFVLMGVFILLFGYTTDGLWRDAVSNLFWTNTFVLLLWCIFIVFFLFRRRQDRGQEMHDYYKGERWRDYRWIVAPAVLILLFLFDTSWAQSTLVTSSLKKSVFKLASAGALEIHAEYPSQILFDDTEPSELRFWAIGPSNEVGLEIYGAGLLFALKPTSHASIEWSSKLEISFDQNTNAVTLLVQPEMPPETNSQFVQLKLNSSGQELETADWLVNIESKRDSQIRDWKKNFLGTGSTVVSLITAVFAGIKQLEEEKKRRKNDQIKEAISNFDADVKNDFSKALQKHLELTADWNEWDRALQEQFRDKYRSLFDGTTFWAAVTGKILTEITSGVDLCLRLCERIFDDKGKKPISMLEQLQSALRMDEQAPLALLPLLKEYPSSINIAKIIASAFSPALKSKTIADYTSEFPNQIRDLRAELGFADTESSPLQVQFVFHAKEHSLAEQLTAWLTAHDLNCSPFADAENPFYFVFDNQFLMDWAAPGFGLPAPNLQIAAFEFANAWDAGAGLFEYCKALQSNVRLKEDLFFAIVTPGMVEKYGAERSRKLLLHALAEQWIWSLAETPTLFYALNDAQRDLAGRLLRWHDFSPSITVNKIAEFSRHSQESRKESEKEEEKNQKVFFSKIGDWLTDVSADDLRTEEINALIGLRPLPKQRTLFLISTIDLNPHAAGQLSPALHETLNEQSNWLSVHDCELVRFLVSPENHPIVSISALVDQCNVRVRKCSKTGNVVFNELFDAPGIEPDAILAQKANGSPGRMVRLGQKLLLQHVQKYPPDKPLRIEDLEALEV